MAFSQKTGAQYFKTSTLDSGKNSSIRGLSVVNNHIAWLSGSNGWIAKTTDGNHFDWKQLKGFEKIDFRDIEAFSKDDAIIVSAGSPGYILKTIDGGKSWKTVYQNNDAEIFLDGLDFWNKKEGIIFGDAIDGLMQILITKDAGETWQNISSKANIQLAKGEGGFAASGTSIRTFKNNVYIATGGLKSKLYVSNDKGNNWKNLDLPILQGEPSQGCFSLAINRNQIFIAGGDYLKDKSSTANYFYANLKDMKWKSPAISPLGYKSCLEFIGENKLITTGTSGTDYSLDNGLTWINLNKESFNVCRKAKKENLILMAGSKGKIVKVEKK
ncbi:WD40/YVTN/BNR-like repeat-containing protein [Pedobacter psychrophilus]|uniref:WD40/YVTN/BNR-like repeat-containing protein n=1 Tax=Pedobacter psychrophilus TaxID=1826909 RepID=UPI0012FDFAF7|nr:oxidoreductase [Pedobacter psychrophilus]